MNPYVIVGGGISGLLTAHSLKKKNIPFILLEKADSVGGRIEVGHHRFYAPSSREFLSEVVEGIEWTEVSDTPKLRRKGEWSEVDLQGLDEEQFYLRQPFFLPKQNFSSVIRKLSEEVSDHIQLLKEVTEVKPDTKTVVCLDGNSISYEKLIWCNSLSLLNNVWKGDKLVLMRLLKKAQELPGGINLTLELSQSIFPSRNSIVFPFRFKDKKLRALGVERENEEGSQHAFTLEWLLFLDEEISEDREEVAKCLRTLRRELEKELPELKASVKQERIVFLSHIAGEAPAEGDSLEILPDVFYIGPQLSIAPEDEPLRNLDLTLINCKHWEQSLPA